MKNIFNKLRSFFACKNECVVENENLPVTALVIAVLSEVKRSARLNPDLSKSELYLIGLLEYRHQLKVNNFV